MKNLLLVVASALAFGTYTIPLAKVAKWNFSIPLAIIGGAMLYMAYTSFFEKMNYLQKPAYSTAHLATYLVAAMVIYGVGYVTFGKLVSGPPEKVQVFASLCTALIPVVALVVPAMLERKMLSFSQFVGLVLVVTGVWFLNKSTT